MQQSIPWSSSVSVFVIERMVIIYSLKCILVFSFVVPVLSLAVTHCYLLSHFITRCHTLSLVVPLVVTRCCLLSFAVTCYHSLSFVVIHFHLLSFVATHCINRCHSLSLVLPIVVTRCHLLLSGPDLDLHKFKVDPAWHFPQSISENTKTSFNQTTRREPKKKEYHSYS